VRRTASVNVNLKRRIFLDQGAGGAGMIQVYVSQQDGIQVRDAKAVSGKLLPKICQCGAWAGVNQSGKIIGAEERGGNASRLPGPVQVKQGWGNHRE